MSPPLPPPPGPAARRPAVGVLLALAVVATAGAGAGEAGGAAAIPVPAAGDLPRPGPTGAPEASSGGPLPIPPPPAVTDTLRARVEESVTPTIVPRGEEPPAYPIRERMERYRVPGVAVAVMEGGEIRWADGYGVADVVTGEPVTPGTLFQAASISKPVAAAAALSLVGEGRLSLDEPVNERLVSWRLPDDSAGNAGRVDLRGLLTHTAGLTVHGFPGYEAGAELPGVREVLDGRPPANTAPVRLFADPGSEWSYSGGGYTVVQQLLVDVTGESFPRLMRERVLRPVGMEASTYAQPLPPARRPEAASAHDEAGDRVEGEWHVYPEMAAAGLWTTPGDLLRFAREIQRAAAGEEGLLLSPEMARRMLEPGRGGWGLGFSIEGEDGERRFVHGGSNHGFKASFVAYVEGGRGVVVMTNGENGGALAREVVLGVARVYGWPGLGPREVDVARVEPRVLRELAGGYVFRQHFDTVRVAVEGGRLVARMGGMGTRMLLPTSDSTYLTEEGGTPLRFERDEAGRGVAIVVADRLRGERVRKEE